MIAFGYVRVSTAEQATGGLGLEAQRTAIEAACARRGWNLADVFEDAGVSGTGISREGLTAAAAACARTDDAVLVVAKLDRLVRSLTAYAALLERGHRERWRLLALDTPETDTPQGEAMQAMTAVFAQLERRLIAQRTKEALAAARTRGVRLGRPPALADDVRALILRLYFDEGQPASRIARDLERQSLLAPHGGPRWHPSTVTRLLHQSGGTLQRGRPRTRASKGES